MGIKRKLEVLASSNLVLARIMNIFIYISSLRYSGTRYECPICNGKFRKFLSGGNENQRQNSKCPRCRSLERHRLVWIYLKHKTNFLKSKQKLLYVAPEYCFRKKFDSLKNIQYISVDLESPLAMKKMDVTNLKFDDSIFDSIICLHVLEHVQDDKKAMREFLRVLKPGGWAILQVPILGEKTYEDDTIKLLSFNYNEDDYFTEVSRIY